MCSKFGGRKTRPSLCLAYSWGVQSAGSDTEEAPVSPWDSEGKAIKARQNKSSVLTFAGQPESHWVKLGHVWVLSWGGLEVVEWLVAQSCGKVARDRMIVFLPLIACFRPYWNILSNLTAERFLLHIASAAGVQVKEMTGACQNI